MPGMLWTVNLFGVMEETVKAVHLLLGRWHWNPLTLLPLQPGALQDSGQDSASPALANIKKDIST